MATPVRLAPPVTPMMSGAARGLRTSVWKISPETPSAIPQPRPTSARGSRRPTMMNSSLNVPEPTSVAATSPSGIGNSPTLTDRAIATTPTTSAPAHTASSRRSSSRENPPARTGTRREVGRGSARVTAAPAVRDGSAR